MEASLKAYVENCREELEKGYAIELDRLEEDEEKEAEPLSKQLENSLDIEYTTSLNRVYQGARIALTLGGPNIYLDTKKGEIQGYWGTNTYTTRVDLKICDFMDDWINEIIELR